MNKLFEQEWSLDDIPADGTVISTKKADTKKADTKKADTKKADTKKADTKKADIDTSKKDRVADAERSANLQKYIKKLISNGIVFYEQITKNILIYDIDEDAVWRLIKNRMIGNGGRDAQLKTAYCDSIIRIINSNSLQTYVKKYSKQYEYFISRNGESGTTIEYLKSINNPYMKRLDNLFVGTMGDWLDFDSEAEIDGQSTMVRRNKLNYHIFNGYKYDPNQKAKVEFKLRYTDSQINSKVLSYYKDNMFGPPKEQFK
jgi:hypothetical protein